MRGGRLSGPGTARAGDDDGVVAVIVVLCLVALMAMLVLTVDVGGLLLKRRAMVNASDAAALAAAQSCADTADTFTPEGRADVYAAANVDGLLAENGGITEVVGCDTGRGHLSVQYERLQQLFFAGVLGFGDEGIVRTAATAAWGPSGSGQAVPIVVESGYLQGTCHIPDGVTEGDTCALWYNNNDPLGDANWGFMNLDQWNVSPTENCSNAGSSDRGDWILNDYQDPLVLNGDPVGTEATYVCNDTGHTTRDWADLVERMDANDVVLFPVNDCAGQLDKSGNVSPCPSTPDKYDIIGFTRLRLTGVYKGNDPAAIGSPGASGTCRLSKATLTTGQVKPLADAYGSGGGCPSSDPDTIAASSVHIYPKRGAEFNQCAPGDLSASCAYWFDDAARTITWRTAATSDLKIQFDWSMNGTSGACGIHPSDPNAICMVTEWLGFTTGVGAISEGADFGASSYALCDLTIGTCPDES
jgi:hypothetical protein